MYGAYDDSSIQYAVKIERSQRGFLKTEKQVYEDIQPYNQSSNGRLFSKVHYFGNHEGYDVLVLDLFDKTLRQVLAENDQVSKTECKRIAKQAISQLEIIHMVGWVHRDLKLKNIMTSGQSDENLHIIDFGHAKTYLSDTGQHCRVVTDTFTGSAHYASINVLSGLRCTRRDDLESLGYALIELRFGLPWSNMRCSTESERDEILAEKILNSPRSICPGFKSIEKYFQTVKRLGFSEKPNYDALRRCFDIA